MRDLTKTAPKLSASLLPKSNDVAAPVTTCLPTPVSCWANDVPDEFQTPVFGGQKPPEEVFAESPVQTQNFHDSQGTLTNEDQTPEEDLGTTDEERIDYAQQVQYDYESQAYYAQGAQYSQEVMPAQEEAPQLTQEDPKVTMLSWYHSMLTWVADTDATLEMHLPPPPPPPAHGVAPHMQPYTFEQWGARITRWHEYVMAEYYNNVIPNHTHTHTQEVQHQEVRPQMRQYTTRANSKYQEPTAAPQPSYYPTYPGYEQYGYAEQEAYYSPQAYQSQVRVHQPYGAIETHEYAQDFPPISPVQPMVVQRKTMKA